MSTICEFSKNSFCLFMCETFPQRNIHLSHQHISFELFLLLEHIHTHTSLSPFNTQGRYIRTHLFLRSIHIDRYILTHLFLRSIHIGRYILTHLFLRSIHIVGTYSHLFLRSIHIGRYIQKHLFLRSIHIGTSTYLFVNSAHTHPISLSLSYSSSSFLLLSPFSSLDRRLTVSSKSDSTLSSEGPKTSQVRNHRRNRLFTDQLFGVSASTQM